MEYKIISTSSTQELTTKINRLISEGWEPIGSHQVVVVHDQNRYRGTQHVDTTHEMEYSQTMVLHNSKTINVDISYYHPDDNENEKVYDEEGMREEFEYKLDCLIRDSGL